MCSLQSRASPIRSEHASLGSVGCDRQGRASRGVWEMHSDQIGFQNAAMPRVSSVPIVSDIRSSWISRVNRVKACLPCRVRHAMSKSRVCCVKGTMSDTPPVSAVASRKLGNQKVIPSRWFRNGLL